MKHYSIIKGIAITILSLFLQSYLLQAQPNFNGNYTATCNGCTFLLKLTNLNGAVIGSLRDISVAGAGASIRARILDANNIKGVQKGNHKRVRFIATEEAGILLLEKRGFFLKSKLDRTERTLRFTKTGEGAAPENNSTPTETKKENN
ncbi:MAG: hypothetical protein ABJB86_15225 [Bacteroidota bacterium]